MKISYAIQALAPHVNNLTKVTCAYTNTLRGVYVDSIDSGILLKRDGSCLIGSIEDGSLVITLEGGLPGWEGAVENLDSINYETPMQLNNLNNLIKYIESRNSKTSINLTR